MIEYISHQSEGLIAVNKNFLQSFLQCAVKIHFLLFAVSDVLAPCQMCYTANTFSIVTLGKAQ